MSIEHINFVIVNWVCANYYKSRRKDLQFLLLNIVEIGIQISNL